MWFGVLRLRNAPCANLELHAPAITIKWLSFSLGRIGAETIIVC